MKRKSLFKSVSLAVAALVLLAAVPVIPAAAAVDPTVTNTAVENGNFETGSLSGNMPVWEALSAAR